MEESVEAVAPGEESSFAKRGTLVSSDFLHAGRFELPPVFAPGGIKTQSLPREVHLEQGYCRSHFILESAHAWQDLLRVRFVLRGSLQLRLCLVRRSLRVNCELQLSHRCSRSLVCVRKWRFRCVVLVNFAGQCGQSFVCGRTGMFPLCDRILDIVPSFLYSNGWEEVDG